MEIRNERLEYIFNTWSKERETWDYNIQINYYKSIKENVSKIQKYLKELEQNPEKRSNLERCYPTNYYFWRCYESNLLKKNGKTSLEILIELNNPIENSLETESLKDFKKLESEQRYLETSKAKLKSNKIEIPESKMNEFFQEYKSKFQEDEKKIDLFLKINKEYYSKIIYNSEQSPIWEVIESVVAVFKNTNSNKASQGANKKVINQSNSLFDVLNIFNSFDSFLKYKEIDNSKIKHAKNVLKEAFSISTLSFQDSFIFNNRVIDVFAVLFKDFQKKKCTIEYVLPFYDFIKVKYKERFVKDIRINAIDSLIKDIPMNGRDDIAPNSYEDLKNNLSINLQIDQMIYYYSKEISKNDFFVFKTNIIFYGAPGTGKTRMAKTSCTDYFNKWKSEHDIMNSSYNEHNGFTQFHPSYNYEGFIEGIRPKGLDKDSKLDLSLEDGVFKKICREAAKYEKDYYEKFYQRFNDYPGINNEREAFNKITKDHLSSLNLNLDEGLLKSILNDRNIEVDEKIIDYVPPYFFIVDEINRADLSKVLGELMYCLEYRGFDSKAKFKTLYSNLSKENNPFFKVKGDDYFFIPHNLYFIGTMNTIDRSVESFDFALRRRFFWIEVKPDVEVIKTELFINGFKKEDISCIINIFTTINLKIEQEFSDQYKIGHSYFLELIKFKMISEKDNEHYNLKEVLDMLWDYNIKPILEEYYRGFGNMSKSIEEYKNIFWKSQKSFKNG